jgi:hypothetical protein
MRKIGVFCVIVTAILGLCIVPSYAGDKPGDQLTEVFKKDTKPKLSLVPAGVKIAKDFKPGKGKAIGTVNAIKGIVLTIHSNEKTAYILKKGNTLYTRDTLISQEQSKARAELNDGSIITLGSYTKMVFDKSVYDPSKPTRNSLLNLLFGKARFIVTKLANFRSSPFKVRTPTAVAGVRGSDFALSVAPGSPLTTTLMTGESTTVAFTGSTGPTQLIGPMSASKATLGMAATTSLPISTYFTAPFLVSGAANFPYWYYVAGGVAAGGAVVLFDDDSDDNPDGPTVTSVNPSEGTSFPGGFAPLTFYFSRDMTPATESNFGITSSDINWAVAVGSVNWPDSHTVQVNVAGSTTPSAGFTITLVGFTDTAGLPLDGKTSFAFSN